MVARVVPQSARRRHAESRKPDLWGRAARPKAPVLGYGDSPPMALWYQRRVQIPPWIPSSCPFPGAHSYASGLTRIRPNGHIPRGAKPPDTSHGRQAEPFSGE